MGLGSIVGTGLFVSLGIAAGVVGHGILLALPLAALLALFNGLSSAQLAAAHPKSGGTYEYAYRFLSPTLGFSAGWMFLLAKSASAATAALGVAGALLLFLGIEGGDAVVRVGIGGATVILLTVLVAGGIRRSNQANLIIVGVTLGIFGLFLAVGLPKTLPVLLDGNPFGLAGSGAGAAPSDIPADRFRGLELLGGGVGALLHAAALLFVAYTGYGRIATLGEEVREPSRTIPKAIWATLGVVTVLYLGVAVVALGSLGAGGFAEATAGTAAPLQVVAGDLGFPLLPMFLAVAAVTAMVGVLLNLLLGLSRVALAMGRRRDLPGALERIHTPTASPRVAVGMVGAVVLALVLLGDVRTTWSFSAFTVLIYYGITNLAALRLPHDLRLYPRWIPVLGLGGCLVLAFQVEPTYWAVGLGLLGAGLIARTAAGRWSTRRSS